MVATFTGKKWKKDTVHYQNNIAHLNATDEKDYCRYNKAEAPYFLKNVENVNKLIMLIQA